MAMIMLISFKSGVWHFPIADSDEECRIIIIAIEFIHANSLRSAEEDMGFTVLCQI